MSRSIDTIVVGVLIALCVIAAGLAYREAPEAEVTVVYYSVSEPDQPPVKRLERGMRVIEQ